MEDNSFIFNFSKSIFMNPFKNTNRSTHSKFIIKFLVLILIIFILDFAIGKTLRYFYYKEQFGRQYRATYAIDKCDANILVFGSSRAYHHYVPNIIEDSLKETCYNTGSPGQFLFYNYATLKAVLKRYTPKMIILDVSVGCLGIEKSSYDRLSFLLPYYKDHPEMRSIIELKGPYEKYKLISSIYPFNSNLLMIAGGNSEYFKAKSVDIKGYKPLNRVLNKPIVEIVEEPYKLDSIKVKILNLFIKDCQDYKIKLYLAYSPAFINYTKTDFSIIKAKQIALNNNVPFFDFTNDTTFTKHPELFDDFDHLNEKGSQLFTKKVISKIKNN